LLEEILRKNKVAVPLELSSKVLIGSDRISSNSAKFSRSMINLDQSPSQMGAREVYLNSAFDGSEEEDFYEKNFDMPRLPIEISPSPTRDKQNVSPDSRSQFKSPQNTSQINERET